MSLTVVFTERDNHEITLDLDISSTQVGKVTKHLEEALKIPSGKACILKSSPNKSSLPLPENSTLSKVIPNSRILFGYILDNEEDLEEEKNEASNISILFKFGQRFYEIEFAVNSKIQSLIEALSLHITVTFGYTIRLYRENGMGSLDEAATVEEIGLKDKEVLTAKKVSLTIVHQVAERDLRESRTQSIKIHYRRLKATFDHTFKPKETFLMFGTAMKRFKTDYFTSINADKVFTDGMLLSDVKELVIANHTLNLEEKFQKAESEPERNAIMVELSRHKTCDVLEKISRSMSLESEEIETIQKILNTQKEYMESIAAGKVEEKQAQERQLRENTEAWGSYYARKFVKGVFETSSKAGSVVPFTTRILTDPALYKSLNTLSNSYMISTVSYSAGNTLATLTKYVGRTVVPILGANVGVALLECTYHLIQFYRGKIGGQKFLKCIMKAAGRNLTSAGAGLTGAALGGEIGVLVSGGNPLGAFIGGLIGTVIGSLVGGWVGDLISEKVYNYIQKNLDKKLERSC